MTAYRPSEASELAAIIGAAVAGEEPLEIVAGGSKRGLGRPLQLPHSLSLAGFAGIRAYEPAELVLTAGAATPLDEIESVLAQSRQMLAFEPGDWRALLGTMDRAPTLGGVLACNLAGPRRIRQGAARDHFLGFAGVSGRGEIFKAGGAVVKNVTGYDLCKLMAGSYGTLAALTEVTVKVLPAPEATRSVILRGLDDAAAVRAMSQALNSAHEIGGAAHLPDGTALTLIRVEGPRPSVEPRAAALARELAGFGPVEIAGDADSIELWRGIRDVAPLVEPRDGIVWRISLAPSQAPAFLARLRGLDCRYFLDWGGGLIWLSVAASIAEGGVATVRGALAGLDGHATLIRAPDAMRVAVPVFQPPAAGVAALSARIKDSFDPRRVLNRGRLYQES